MYKVSNGTGTHTWDALYVLCTMYYATMYYTTMYYVNKLHTVFSNISSWTEQMWAVQMEYGTWHL